MKIYLDRNNENKEIKFRGSVKELLNKLELNPESVIVAKNNELVTEDETLNNEDEIKIFSVISGG